MHAFPLTVKIILMVVHSNIRVEQKYRYGQNAEFLVLKLTDYDLKD